MSRLHRTLQKGPWPFSAAVLAVTGGITLWLVLTRSGESPELARRVAAPLDSAAASVAALLDTSAQSTGVISAEAAIAAGYLERHRLGLANPFRLAEFALADSQLSAGSRRGVAWLLLRQAYFARGYALPAAALRALSGGDALTVAQRDAHVALVERAMRDSDDPRGAELGLRLAYQIAVSERTTPFGVARVVVRIAALARDRELARRDAHALVAAARASGKDPLTLVPSWRASLRFAVERPVWNRAAWEARATVESSRWLATLRTISADTSQADMTVEHEPPLGSMTRGVATRLLALSADQRLAPQAAVVLATREQARRASRGGGESLRASNEEAMAAELSLLSPDTTGAAALAVLEAAVGLRTLAQERVWFPGDPAPTEREIRRRFGYASVEFEPGVPLRWRGYLLRSLAGSTAELQRVLPTFTVTGAHVRFSARAPNDTLLALHVAQSRTLILPIGTGSGTLAHELAHDLDARAARTRYSRGGYATDLAVRRQDGRMAASVAGLTRAPLVAPTEGGASPHRQRPAEVFARTIEWLVPAALARDGRMNGFLSSVQDEQLTGAGSVLPTDVSLGAVPALADVLEEMPAPESQDAARAIRARFAGGSEWTAQRLVRLVLETPLPSDGPARATDGWSFRDPTGSLAASLPVHAPRCSGGQQRSGGEWRDALVRAMVDARLRGIARFRVRTNALGAGSVARLLGLAGPWNEQATETVVERAREVLLARVYDRVDGEGTLPAALDGEPAPAVCVAR